jgi:peptidylprolyl isomerase
MKRTALILILTASTAAAIAQTPSKPAVVAHMAAAETLPSGIPPVKGAEKTLFTLRYQEIKIGAGAEAEPYKLYTVQYTGWLAADGHKFDSSYDHPRPPVLDKDGKPVMGADGKPEQGPAEPIRFPQGFGRVIAGFDQGFTGMRIGGERRLFIPWELAYGAMGRPGPDADHPGIPPKADLIFDIELVGVTDMPMPSNHPGMTGGMHSMPGMHPLPATPAHTDVPATPATPAAPAAQAQPK